MKNNIKIISLILCLMPFYVLGQHEKLNYTDSQGKKQGHWVKLDDNNKKKYAGGFVNDIPTGKFIYYFETGTPWAITYFSENGRLTRTQMFDGGGKMTAEGKYINEKRDSVWKFYNNSEKLISIENYIKGVKDGAFVVYYSNGEIAEEKMWKKGVLEGPCNKYFETGVLKYQGLYSNNKVEGKATFFHSSGKVYAEGVYNNDMKQGKWKYYKEDGTVSRVDSYTDGKHKKGTNPNVITKEQVEKEKKESEQFEIKNPYQGRQ